MDAVERLYSYAVSLIDDFENKEVFDLYCGTGTITQVLARKAKEVIGIELAAAAQAIWLRQEMGEQGIDNLAPATRAAYDFIRSKAEPVEKDILMIDYLAKFDEMVKDHSILEAVEKVAALK